MDFASFAAALKKGSWVIVIFGYGPRTGRVEKVSKITNTQIIVGDLRFNKSDGVERSSDSYFRRSKIDTVLPSSDQIERAKERIARNAADKAEHERLKELCESAMAKLQPILGSNVKVMRWSTNGNGSVVFKIEVENMTEGDVRNIAEMAERAAQALDTVANGTVSA